MGQSNSCCAMPKTDQSSEMDLKQQGKKQKRPKRGDSSKKTSDDESSNANNSQAHKNGHAKVYSQQYNSSSFSDGSDNDQAIGDNLSTEEAQHLNKALRNRVRLSVNFGFLEGSDSHRADENSECLPVQASFEHSGQQHFGLVEKALEFVDGKQLPQERVLLVHGASGTGKSHFLHDLAQQLQVRKKHFIFIEDAKQLSEQQTKFLQCKNTRCTLLIDALENLQAQKSLALETFGKRVRVVACIRSGYCSAQQIRDILQTNTTSIAKDTSNAVVKHSHRTKHIGVQNVYLCALSDKKQREEFVDRLFSGHGWLLSNKSISKEQLRAAQRATKNLCRRQAQSYFGVLVTAFLQLRNNSAKTVKNYKEEEEGGGGVEATALRTKYEQLQLCLQSAFCSTESALQVQRTRLEQLCTRICATLVVGKTSDSVLENELITLAKSLLEAPLIREKSDSPALFVHESFQDFYATRAIIEEVLSMDTNSEQELAKNIISQSNPLNMPPQNFSRQHEIIRLFAEYCLTCAIEQREQIFARLKSFVLLSRANSQDTTITLAANALTLLNHSGFNFVGQDFSDIVAPNCDLSGALLVRTRLRGAQLRGADLTHAVLDAADLSASELTDAHLALTPILKGHQGPVNCIAYSPDGRFIASGSHDKSVRVWGSSDYRDVARLKGHFEGQIFTVCFSPDSKRLAAGGRDGIVRIFAQKDDGKFVEVMHLIDAEEGEEDDDEQDDQQQQHQDEDQEDDDGHRIRAGDSESEGGSEESVSSGGSGQQGGGRGARRRAVSAGPIIRSLCFSHNGEQLLGSRDDGIVKLWTLRTPRREVRFYQAHEGKVRSASFAPPDSILFVSAGDDQCLRIWSVNDTEHELACAEQAHEGDIYTVDFAPDARTFASSGEDCVIKVWTFDSAGGGSTKGNSKQAVTGTLKEQKRLLGHESAVLCVSHAADGLLLASASRDETVRVWNLAQGSEIALFANNGGEVFAVAFSPLLGCIACGGDSGILRIHDVSAGNGSCDQEAKSLGDSGTSLRGHRENVTALALCPDGDTLISAAEDEGQLLVWSLREGRLRSALPLQHTGGVTALAIFHSADGAPCVLSASRDTTLRAWDLRALSTLGEALCGESGELCALAVLELPANSVVLAATGTEQGAIELWEVRSQTCRGRIANAHKKAVLAIAISPDGARVAAGCEDKTIKIFQLDNRYELASIKAHKGPVRALYFSQDGKQLVSGADDKIVRFWNLNTFQSDAEIKTPASGNIVRFLFSKQQNTVYVASGSKDGCVRVWRVSDGALAAELYGHESSITALALSGDGAALVSASLSIRVWRLNKALSDGFSQQNIEEAPSDSASTAAAPHQHLERIFWHSNELSCNQTLFKNCKGLEKWKINVLKELGADMQ